MLHKIFENIVLGGIKMNKIIENNTFETSNIKIIVKGIILAIASSMILLVLFSAALTYTSVPESASNIAIIILSAISILFSSQLAARRIKKNGIVNGGIIGGVYIIIIYLLSSIISGNFSLGINAIIMTFSSIIAGMLGGIIGVNLK